MVNDAPAVHRLDPSDLRKVGKKVVKVAVTIERVNTKMVIGSITQ